MPFRRNGRVGWGGAYAGPTEFRRLPGLPPYVMWVLLQAGEVAVVPQPRYPIHVWGPYLAGADVRQVAMGGDQATAGSQYIDDVMAQWEYGWPRPRVVVLSFPR